MVKIWIPALIHVWLAVLKKNPGAKKNYTANDFSLGLSFILSFLSSYSLLPSFHRFLFRPFSNILHSADKHL